MLYYLFCILLLLTAYAWARLSGLENVVFIHKIVWITELEIQMRLELHQHLIGSGYYFY